MFKFIVPCKKNWRIRKIFGHGGIGINFAHPKNYRNRLGLNNRV